MQFNRLEKLKLSLVSRQTSDFGIGVVSKNTVDAAIRVAYQRNQPLMLIASRRQIECAALGGGYVENWSTESFAKYVRSQDPQGLILLCRDHGGPWQHPSEWDGNFSESEALESAKVSYQADIDSDFDIIHIDTGISPQGEPSLPVAVERLIHLYEWCDTYSRKVGKQIAIEVGTEDQRGEADNPKTFAEIFDAIESELNRRHLPRPLFAVAQTGTKVIEAKNIGAFTKVHCQQKISKDVTAIAHYLKERGTFIKAHNCDYLSDKDLTHFASLGVGAINVAPEIGVRETQLILGLLKETGLTKARNRFIELAYQSAKWKKWLAPKTQPTPLHCCVLSGHYIYSTPEFHDIKYCLAQRLKLSIPELDQKIVKQLTLFIERYFDRAEAPCKPSLVA